MFTGGRERVDWEQMVNFSLLKLKNDLKKHIWDFTEQKVWIFQTSCDFFTLNSVLTWLKSNQMTNNWWNLISKQTYQRAENCLFALNQKALPE